MQQKPHLSSPTLKTVDKKLRDIDRVSYGYVASSAMTFHKLCIAWSVFCGLACVLLIVLWARSYRRHETVSFDEASRTTAGGWNKGELFFVTNELPLAITLPRKFTFRHEEPDYEHDFEGTHLGFQLTSMPG